MSRLIYQKPGELTFYYLLLRYLYLLIFVQVVSFEVWYCVFFKTAIGAFSIQRVKLYFYLISVLTDRIK